MKIRRFNESFNGQEYIDYLLSEVDEKKINYQDSSEFFLYIEYDISSGESDRIDNYIKVSPRFNDVISISKYDFDLNYYRLLLVDRFFYSRNQKWIYQNLKWDTHPIAISMKDNIYDQITLSYTFDRYKKVQKALDLPGSISIIRNLDRIGQVEIWDDKTMEHPIRIWEENTPELQYLLFKYLGK